MRVLGLLMLAVAVSEAVAGDCPQPKRLTCEQLLSKAKQRGCLEPKTPCPEPSTVTVVAPAPECICTTAVGCGECPEPQTFHEYVYMDPAPAEPKGKWLVGGGPLYQGTLGLTVVGGYAWGSGWMLLGGPVWVPQYGGDPISGVATDGCVKIPYTVPGAAPGKAWGAQVLAVYSF